MSKNLEKLLATLASLSKPQLADIWKQSFKTEPNRQWRKTLLLPLLTYKLHEQAARELSSGARHQLRQLLQDIGKATDVATLLVRRLKPGTCLVRKWRGQAHVVHVQAEGFDYKGTCHASLSEVARRITGTRWVGALVFWPEEIRVGSKETSR